MAKNMTATIEKTEKAAPSKKGRRKGLRHPRLILFLLFVLLLLSPFLLVNIIEFTQQGRIYTQADAVPERPVAIVFGAGLNRDGTPSPILADRVNAGVELYQKGKVQRLIMTGDGISNSEVTAMRDYAVRKGVPTAAIIADSEGLRTYDSCWRAANTFNIKQAVLVTQAYHLPRALFTCNSLGVDAVGLKAGRDYYPGQNYYNTREFMATLLSWVDVTITHPKPGD